MAKASDAIIPILRKIQQDLPDLKRGQEKMDSRFDALNERMDVFEGYFTSTMGLTQQNKADIDLIRRDIGEIKRRLASIETNT